MLIDQASELASCDDKPSLLDAFTREMRVLDFILLGGAWHDRFWRSCLDPRCPWDWWTQHGWCIRAFRGEKFGWDLDHFVQRSWPTGAAGWEDRRWTELLVSLETNSVVSFINGDIAKKTKGIRNIDVNDWSSLILFANAWIFSCKYPLTTTNNYM